MGSILCNPSVLMGVWVVSHSLPLNLLLWWPVGTYTISLGRQGIGGCFPRQGIAGSQGSAFVTAAGPADCPHSRIFPTLCSHRPVSPRSCQQVVYSDFWIFANLMSERWCLNVAWIYIYLLSAVEHVSMWFKGHSSFLWTAYILP